MKLGLIGAIVVLAIGAGVYFFVFDTVPELESPHVAGLLESEGGSVAITDGLPEDATAGMKVRLVAAGASDESVVVTLTEKLDPQPANGDGNAWRARYDP